MYGGTAKPAAIEAYGITHLIGDVIGSIAALRRAGRWWWAYDWGALVAWFSAPVRPRRGTCRGRPERALLPAHWRPARGPHRQRPDAGQRQGSRLLPPTRHGRGRSRPRGRRGPHRARLPDAISGDIIADGVRHTGWDGHFPLGETLSAQLVQPERLPSWLSEDDVAFYTAELQASGFRGGLNWYRNIDRLPGLLACLWAPPSTSRRCTSAASTT
ncbi:MAG: hypothetical protein R2749_10915 [Acidimicrobiales bacterium]